MLFPCQLARLIGLEVEVGTKRIGLLYSVGLVTSMWKTSAVQTRARRCKKRPIDSDNLIGVGLSRQPTIQGPG